MFEVVFGEWLGIDWTFEQQTSDRVELSLIGGNGTVSFPDTFFGTGSKFWKSRRSLPESDFGLLELTGSRWGVVSGKSIPVIYGESHLGQLEIGTQKMPFDVFGTIFFLISRYEETVEPISIDEHGRYKSSNSKLTAVLTSEPLADIYLCVLRAILQFRWENLSLAELGFSVRFTHDVDQPFTSLTSTRISKVRMLGNDAVRMEPSVLLRRILTYTTNKTRFDPNYVFPWLVRLYEERDQTAVFNIMYAKPSRFDLGYPITHPLVQRLLLLLAESNQEMGFHPSYVAGSSKKALLLEYDQLCHSAAPFGLPRPVYTRQHYLRWNVSSTWSTLEEAGLKTSSNLAFPDSLGFRAGTARSYSAWCWRDRRKLSIKEEPLTSMDTVLFSRHRLSLSLEEAQEDILKLANSVKRFGGTFTMLWHNDFLVESRERSHYKDLVDKLLNL